MKVYRDYTQEELDRQYEHRNIVSNPEEFTERSRSESARVRAAAEGRFDVPYGDHPDQLLDVFLAPGTKDAPIVVFFHGGRWSMGNKSTNCEAAEAYNASGVHFVSVNFTLVPNTDMDGLIGQCRDAVAWVFRNAASFGGDRERVFIMGKSSGGHVAAMMLTTDWEATHGLPADTTKGGLVVSGMYDLEPVRLTFRNDTLRLDPESAARNSPILHIPPKAGAIVVGCGTLESDEFRRQAREFANAWREAGHPAQLVEVAGRHHFSINQDMADEGSPLLAPFLELVGRAAAPVGQ